MAGWEYITLTNGQRYYMLQVHYDPSWSGADDFAATYKTPSDPIRRMATRRS